MRRIMKKDVASKLYTRAFILGFSYHTTWIYYLEEWEKGGYDFEVIMRVVADQEFRYQSQTRN